jgi:Xaa-Pro aminopeptidase
MGEQGVGLLYLTPGANLFYLTGVMRHEQGGTDHNAWGDWAVGAYLGLEGDILFLAPRMGGAFYQVETRDKPWLAQVRLIQEAEDPLDVMRDTLKHFNLNGQRIALDDRAWAQTVRAFQRLLPDNEYTLASPLIAPMRMIKEEAELDLMRHAGVITDQVFQKALAVLRPGCTEVDVASEIDHQFKAHGAEYTSFVTGIRFVGPGQARTDTDDAPRASEKKLMPGDSVTFDFGCVYQGYCSDFGRSAFVGEPPAEYLKVHDIVLRSQQAGMAAMKAGQTTGAEVNRVARKVIEDEGYGPYFTHRLGHGIGVTVHETPWLDSVEKAVLQENMTFTVEPSIRVPDRFGNRVEDIVLVTPAGGVSLYNTDRRLYIVD